MWHLDLRFAAVLVDADVERQSLRALDPAHAHGDLLARGGQRLSIARELELEVARGGTGIVTLRLHRHFAPIVLIDDRHGGVGDARLRETLLDLGFDLARALAPGLDLDHEIAGVGVDVARYVLAPWRRGGVRLEAPRRQRM